MFHFLGMIKDAISDIWDSFTGAVASPSEDNSQDAEEIQNAISDATSDIQNTLKHLDTLSKFDEDKTMRWEETQAYMGMKTVELPAYLKYGDTTGELDEVSSRLESLASDLKGATSVDDVYSIQSDIEDCNTELASIRNEIQSFMSEQTSQKDYAKWWYAKMIQAGISSGWQQHNARGSGGFDSEVWSEFRIALEADAVGISSFGSENAWNVLYNIMLDGGDSGDLLNILVTNDIASVGGFEYDVTIPYF